MLKRLVLLDLCLAAMLTATRTPIQAVVFAPPECAKAHLNLHSRGDYRVVAQALSFIQEPEQTPASGQEHSVRLGSPAPSADNGRSRTPWDHLLIWGPWAFAFITAIAAGLQIWLLLRTWETIKRLTDLFERQNDAAARATAAYINKERPKLFIVTEITPEFHAAFYAVNRGLSPARITYEFVHCEIYGPDEHFPQVPDYARGGKPGDYVTDKWVVPKNSDMVGSQDAGSIWDKNPELFKAVMGRAVTAWFYGVVRWVDSVSEDEHELRFCYECWVREDGKPSLFASGPASYRLEK
jgi:hypothetical protein